MTLILAKNGQSNIVTCLVVIEDLNNMTAVTNYYSEWVHAIFIDDESQHV